MSRPRSGAAPRLTLAPAPDQGGAPVARATPAPDREQLRADVRHLIDQGISNRAIASRLPVSKDTVRRWREEWSAPVRAEEATDAPPAEPPATVAHEPAPPADPGTGAAHATPAPDAPGRLTVAVDEAFQNDLDLLFDAGLDPQEAITTSLRFLANALRDVWQAGVYPHGVLPPMRIRSYPPQPTDPKG